MSKEQHTPIEKLYYNFDMLNESYVDISEYRKASDTLETAMGEEIYTKYNDDITDYASANERFGFIC